MYDSGKDLTRHPQLEIDLVGVFDSIVLPRDDGKVEGRKIDTAIDRKQFDVGSVVPATGRFTRCDDDVRELRAEIIAVSG